MIYDNLTVNEQGHLCIAGQDAVALAKEYGDPLWIMDEERLRANMRAYKEQMALSFGEASRPLYASKAASFLAIYQILAEEGLYTDCSSAGEIYTARTAGFPSEHIFFHGNNKTDEDIQYALDEQIGYFIVDNLDELDALNKEAAARGCKQKILLRLTPGTKVETKEKINTAKIDVQFGVPMMGDLAENFVKAALSASNLQLEGIHCHLGSQIADTAVYIETFETIFSFAHNLREKLDYTMRIFDLGGGFAVPYKTGDPSLSIRKGIQALAEGLDLVLEKYAYPKPIILMEPGRSIVADTTITMYKVGSVREIPNVRNYITVNGGMTDNPRYALYQADYTVYAANKMHETYDFPCTLAGRCCETGDILQENIFLPKLTRGDYIAVSSTGAYNYSMASNYNRLPKPALLLISPRGNKIVVQRESFADLIRNDIYMY